MFLAATLVGWIGGDSVYRKTAAKNIYVSYLFQVHGRSDTPGPEFCPQIESINSDLAGILVASMSEVNVTIVVKHLQVDLFTTSTFAFLKKVSLLVFTKCFSVIVDKATVVQWQCMDWQEIKMLAKLCEISCLIFWS